MLSPQRDKIKQMKSINTAQMMDEIVRERPLCYGEIAYGLSSLNNRIYHLIRK